MGDDSEAAAAGPVVEDAWAMEGRSQTEMGKIVLHAVFVIRDTSIRDKLGDQLKMLKN